MSKRGESGAGDRFNGSAGTPAMMEAFNIGSVEASADLPPMRAVAMTSNAPTLIQDGGLSFGMAKPSLGLSRPALGLKLEGKSLRSNSFGVQKEWSGLAPSTIWDVKAEDLELLPDDFPLERTHRCIEGVDASVVATRISDVLRSHSIEAEYDCKKAKAKCKTSDYVSFRIRLYAGGESGDPVVVEIQRRCGSTSSFMRSCRAILNAAEGKNTDAPAQVKVRVLKPLGNMKFMESIEIKEVNQEADAVAALDSAFDMLQSKQMDVNALGLENIVCLTDVMKTNHFIAARVSKCVALGDKTHDLREEIRVLTERDVYSVGMNSDEGTSKHADHLRHLALSAFANALCMCSKDGSLRASGESQKWLTDHLMPALLDELKRSASNGCNAVSATVCLYSLVKESDLARRSFIEYGGLEALEQANTFGKAQHELLANETARCMKLFDVPV